MIVPYWEQLNVLTLVGKFSLLVKSLMIFTYSESAGFSHMTVEETRIAIFKPTE